MTDTLIIVLIVRETWQTLTTIDGQTTLRSVSEFAHDPPSECDEEQYARWYGEKDDAQPT